MKEILLTILASLIIVSTSRVSAAQYNFNFTGPKEATNGQTVTLTVTGTGLTGKVMLSSTNASLSNSQVWVEKNSISVTAKITGFPATITATPSELTDDDYNIVNLASKTIKINEKKTEVTPTPPSGGSNGGSSGGSSSGGSNSGGTSSGGGNTGSTNRPSTPSKPSQGSSSQHSPDKPSTPNESNIQNNGDVKSGNNYLQSISLSAGNLSPEFYRETFEYTIENIEENIEELEISAVAEDERANISGLGKVTINSGENRYPISVTAENGNTREYTLVLNTKEEIKESDLRLKTLEIKKINREGEFNSVEFDFNPENYEYNIDVEEDITDLDVNATVEKEGIIVETTGEKNLKDGENIVIITLTSQEDNTIQTTYKIKVNKDVAVETLSQVVKLNEPWKIAVITIGLILLAIELILYIVLKKKRKIK